MLLKAKELLAHGQFQDWLRDNFNMSSKTANRLMSVAKMVQNLDLETDMVEKLAHLDLGIIYAISAKSTSEDAQRQIFEEIAQNHPISCELIRLIKKNIDPKVGIKHLEDALHQEEEFLQFVKVLKKFSTWIDDHQPQLYSPQQEIQTDLKKELEMYAQKLKDATDVVNEILEHKSIKSPTERFIAEPRLASVNMSSTMSALI